MNTKQIEYVLELNKTKNFNLAAENLFISQPTLTYQIKNLENEIGFRIFDRDQHRVSLTHAGEQFIKTLNDVYLQINEAIQQCQNISSHYTDSIRIIMPIRSVLHLLPQVMKEFRIAQPDILVTPSFSLHHSLRSFLADEADILISYRDAIKNLNQITVRHLYTSRLYLVTNHDDPLSHKKIITADDLVGRTLMVGGTSQPPLRALQNRLIHQVQDLSWFNSNDHDTSLTNVAAGNAVVISPGYLNDHTNQFAWIPFDCPETIEVVICTHDTSNLIVESFVQQLIKTYSDTCPIR